MATREPSDRLVFTHGLPRSPRATAFRTSSPAPTITEGWAVSVQDVIAAITTAASVTCSDAPADAAPPGTGRMAAPRAAAPFRSREACRGRRRAPAAAVPRPAGGTYASVDATPTIVATGATARVDAEHVHPAEHTRPAGPENQAGGRQ